MKSTLFIFTCVLLLQLYLSQYHINRVNPFKQLSETLRMIRTEGCDGSILKLQCPKGTKISIQSVHYGSSKTRQQCSAFLSKADTSCSAKSSLRRIEAECQSKSECVVNISPQNLIAEGVDPCPFIRKQAIILYQCKPSSFRSSLVCKGDDLSLSCADPHERLIIFSSFFSSASSGPIYCPLNTEDTQPAIDFFQDSSEIKNVKKCENNPVTKSIMKFCHGQQHCNVSSEHEILNAKECQDLHIFLKTTFTCVLKDVIKADYIDIKIDFIIQENDTKYNHQENTSTNHLSSRNQSNTDTIENSPVDFIKIVDEKIFDINIDPMLQNSSVIQNDSTTGNNTFKTRIKPKIYPKSNEFIHEENEVLSEEKEKDYLDLSEAEILTDLSTSEWSVLSEDINLDILPLEQDLTRVSKGGQYDQQWSKYIKDNEAAIIITSTVIIAVLLISILILITGRFVKRFISSDHRHGTAMSDSDSSYQSYPAILPEPSLFSTSSPVYGTVGRKIRPTSRPLSGSGVSDTRKIYLPEDTYSYVGNRSLEISDKENRPDLYFYG